MRLRGQRMRATGASIARPYQRKVHAGRDPARCPHVFLVRGTAAVVLFEAAPFTYAAATVPSLRPSREHVYIAFEGHPDWPARFLGVPI